MSAPASASAYLRPELVGIAASLTAAALFSLAALSTPVTALSFIHTPAYETSYGAFGQCAPGGCHLALGWTARGVSPLFRIAGAVLLPLAAISQLASCIALVADYRHRKVANYPPMSVFATIIAAAALVATHLEYAQAYQALEASGMGPRTGWGMFVAGQALHASIIGFIAGFPVLRPDVPLAEQEKLCEKLRGGAQPSVYAPARRWMV